MHILYFHQHFSTPEGSIGTRSYEMARRLIAAGNRVTMVCGSFGHGHTGLDTPFTNGKREGLVDGIEVIEFDLSYRNSDGFLKRSLTFARFALRSVQVALRRPADLVFATSTPLTVALPGIAARWLRRKPFVFEVRDLWPEIPREMGAIKNPLVLGAMAVLEWVAYRSANRLVGLSPGIAEGIARHNVAADRIAMVPNGCDIDLFNGAVEPWRPDGVGPDDFLAVFAGTHGNANGLGAVVDAAAELKRRNIGGIKLLLVGQGMEKPKLLERASTERLDDYLIFMDPVPKTRLSGLLAGADLGLQILANVPAFYYGTSPNKFFDYLAAGLPVLTNYPGWVAELVTQNAAGVAASPDDPSAFVDALLEAKAGIAAGRVSGANAFALAKREFDRDLLGQRWIDFVTGAVAVPSAGSAGR
jgi:glycosyltransferase involved in cell wall biosynthesis